MSPKIRILIVDDVELARRRIRLFLAQDSEIEIIDECENGRAAISLIKEEKPDLVFLDVQMPETSGFDVVDAVGADKMPAVIFVTAYDQFAIKAFEVNAVDYLLKPFNKQRFFSALERAKREIRRNPVELDGRLVKLLEQLQSRQEPKYLKRISVKTENHIFFVPTEEIEWIKAAGNYVEVHTNKKKHLVRGSVGQLEKTLDPDKFARIHRSVIVNIDFIKTMHPLFSGDHLVVMLDGTKLNMSRSHHKKLI